MTRPGRRAPAASPARSPTVERGARDVGRTLRRSTGWVARDVVRHLVEWFPAFLAAGAGITLPAGPSVDDDPVGAWQAHDRRRAGAARRPGRPPTASTTNPHIGRMPLAQAIDMIYTTDVFMHRWDLARATGQDETLDPDKCARDARPACCRWTRCCARAASTAPRVAGPRRRRRPDQAAGFIGRDPHWRP